MAENEPEEEGDLASRLAGALGGDPDARKPVSLTEALYQRVIDVTRAEVSQTTEVLGEVVVQIGRLERRFNSLAAHFEGDVPLPDGGGGLQQRLERLDELLARLETGTPSTLPAEPADSGEVAQVISRGLAEIRTALLTSQPDLTPVVRAINQSVDDMRAEIAGLQPGGSTQAGAADNEVLIHWMSELRAALTEIRDRLSDAGDRPAELDAAVTSSAARVEAALADLRDSQSEVPHRVGTELEALATALRSEMASLRASLPQAEPTDLRPVLEAIHGLAAGVRDELASVPSPEPVDLSPVQAQLADLRQALPQPTDLEPLERALGDLSRDLAQAVNLQPIEQAMTDLSRAVAEVAPSVDLTPITSALDELRRAIPAPPDADEIGRVVSSDVADAVRASVAGATGDLSTRVEDLQAGLAALAARYAAKMDELRNGVADDAERLAERIDAVAERAGRAPDLSPLVDDIRAELATLRSALPPPTEPVDLAPVHEEVAATRAAQEQSVATMRAALDDAVARLREHATDEAERVRQSLPREPEPVDLGPIHQSLDDLRADLTASGAGLHEAVSAIRDRVEQPQEALDLSPIIERIEQALRDTAEDLKSSRPGPPDLTPVLAALTHLQESLAASGAEQADRVAAAADAVRAQQEHQHQALLARLGSLGDELRADLPPPVDLSPVLERIDTASTEARLAAETERDAAAAAADQARDALAAHLDRIRSEQHEQVDALASAITRVSDHITSQPSDEVLIGEVRGLLDGLRDEMAAVRSSIEPQVLLDAFAQGTDQAVDRLTHSAEAAMTQLGSATEGVMARIDRRDSQLGSIKVDLENAVQRALREAEDDMARIVGDVRSAVDALTHGIEGVQTGLRDNDHRDELRDLTRSIDSGLTDLGGAVATDLSRVTATLSELTRDLGSTRERVLELDRNLTGLRNEVGGTAEVAQASYQTADTLQALIPAIASLENRVGAQLDDLTARLDALAALVDDRVPSPPPPGQRQEKIALEVGTRLDAIREVAAGISEALRNDRKKRRNRALGSGRG